MEVGAVESKSVSSLPPPSQKKIEMKEEEKKEVKFDESKSVERKEDGKGENVNKVA